MNIFLLVNYGGKKLKTENVSVQGNKLVNKLKFDFKSYLFVRFGL